MTNWEEKLEKAHEKLKRRKEEKLQAGRSAKQQIDKVYEEFFKKKITSAFEMVKSKFVDKYRVELYLPKESKYSYVQISASLALFAKKELHSGKMNELSEHSDEIYRYSIRGEIPTDFVVINSSHHFLYRDDVKRTPNGNVVNRSDYGKISIEDICDDIICGYERIIDEGVI